MVVLAAICCCIVFLTNEYSFRRGLQSTRNLRASVSMAVILMGLFVFSLARLRHQFNSMQCSQGKLYLIYAGGKQVGLSGNDIKDAKIVKFDLRVDHSYHVYILTFSGESYESNSVPSALLLSASVMIGVPVPNLAP
jgi:hypothetical protein